MLTSNWGVFLSVVSILVTVLALWFAERSERRHEDLLRMMGVA
jgi:hypothetical protein